MKVWEETWEADEDRVWDPKERVTIAFGPMAEDAAKLCAAAPEMARLLLKLEWRGAYQVGIGDGCDSCCPDCEMPAPILVHEKSHLHAPDCELAAVLRKAGVLRHGDGDD